MTLLTWGAALSMAAFCAAVTGPLLWVKSWRLISARMRVSTPAKVDSRAGWAPLAASRASRVAGLGGAAWVVAAVKARIKGRRMWEGFMEAFFVGLKVNVLFYLFGRRFNAEEGLTVDLLLRNQVSSAPNTSTLHQSGKYPSRIKKSSM